MRSASWIESVRRRAGSLAALAFGAVLLSGCATTSGPGWGADATLRPGWQRIGEAAARAARDPEVLGTLAGAGVVAAAGWDRQISDWARRRTPLFGSRSAAVDWSDRLRSVAVVTDTALVIAAPQGPGMEGLEDKAKGYLVHLGAATAAIETTAVVKRAARRERPDASDDLGFPSGHATTTAAYTLLADRTLEAFDMGEGARLGARLGLGALDATTAWARIEAGAHFPSDVLAGLAIGRFVSATVHDSFLPGSAPGGLSVSVAPLPHRGLALQFDARF